MDGVEFQNFTASQYFLKNEISNKSQINILGDTQQIIHKGIENLIFYKVFLRI